LLFRIPGNVGHIFRENRWFVISKAMTGALLALAPETILAGGVKQPDDLPAMPARFPSFDRIASKRTTGGGQRIRRSPAGNDKKVSFRRDQYGWIRGGHRLGSSVRL